MTLSDYGDDMIQTLLTCDRCGAEAKGEYPKIEAGEWWGKDIIGAGWMRMIVYRPGSEGAAEQVVGDICTECVEAAERFFEKETPDD